MPPEPRLATHMVVSALIRQASAQGDFATLLQKGDATAGALLLLARCKGQILALFEQFPALDGSRKWAETSAHVIDNEQKLAEYLDRRSASDPDLWVLELDVAFPERLSGLLSPPP